MANNREMLLNSIRDKNADLAGVLQSAMNVLGLDPESIPDQIRIASYCIRELINKLPYYYNLPIQKSTVRLGDLAGNLESRWTTARIEQYIDNDYDATGKSKINSFLIQCRSFLEENRKINPSRREKAITIIQELNSMHNDAPLTPAQEERTASEWNMHLEYFNEVAHKNPNTIERTDFITAFDEFINFLTRLFALNIQENIIELDSLIQRGESGAA